MFKTIKCKTCGASSFKKINNDTYECRYCGIQIHKRNVNCEKETETKSLKIEEDIEMLVDEQEEKIKNNKKGFALTKLLICIFLGQFGVHRFMEGKIFSGLIYCFTQGVFGIGIFVDIIRLAKELSGASKEEEE